MAVFLKVKSYVPICLSKETNIHEEGMVFLEHDFPKYFNAIRSERAVVADDAHTHTATFEFSESYLKAPLKSISMLDVPIRVDGALVALLCCEQTYEPKIWTDEDIIFVHSITDIISLGIEADKRKKAEAKLLENQEQLIYKSNILAAIAKTTEQLLVSKNIYETLTETFELIGNAANVDRVFFFENDLKNNLISQKIEWTRGDILPQIDNLVQRTIFRLTIFIFILKFYTKIKYTKKHSVQLQTKISKIDGQNKISWLYFYFRFLSKMFFKVLLVLMIVPTSKNGRTTKSNILQSFATNIANAIERLRNEAIIEESENNFRQINDTIDDVFFLYDAINEKHIYISSSCKKVLGAGARIYFYQRKVLI
ncbi:MAG: GAF domain-containing protein [Arcicella sp.]|nr:GAF domain-containing protein [Arcicella sp.]